jgi:hypothetical protein
MPPIAIKNFNILSQPPEPSNSLADFPSIHSLDTKIVYLLSASLVLTGSERGVREGGSVDERTALRVAYAGAVRSGALGDGLRTFARADIAVSARPSSRERIVWKSASAILPIA